MVALSIVIAGGFAIWQIYMYSTVKRSQTELAILNNQLNGLSAISAKLALNTVFSNTEYIDLEAILCLKNSGSAPETLDISSPETLTIAKLDIEGRQNQTVKAVDDFSYSSIQLNSLLRPENILNISSIYLPNNVEKCFSGIRRVREEGTYVLQFWAKPNLDVLNRSIQYKFIDAQDTSIRSDNQINIGARIHFHVINSERGFSTFNDRNNEYNK